MTLGNVVPVLPELGWGEALKGGLGNDRILQQEGLPELKRVYAYFACVAQPTENGLLLS